MASFKVRFNFLVFALLLLVSLLNCSHGTWDNFIGNSFQRSPLSMKIRMFYKSLCSICPTLLINFPERKGKQVQGGGASDYKKFMAKKQKGE